MTTFVLRRLAATVPLLLGATFVIWAMVFVLPGDPIRALSGFKPQPPAVNRALREQYNLDDPLLVQYVKYLGDVLRLDFGSTFTGREVSDLLRETFPHTLRILLVAVVFMVVVGIGAGTSAAFRRRGMVDRGIMLVTALCVAVPTVVVAPFARHYLAVEKGWFPSRGVSSGWTSYLLPGIILGLVSMAAIARLLRSEHLEALRSEYVRTANAKGLRRRRVIGVHSMRNSLQPVVAFIGADIPLLLATTAVVETVFDIPGVGRLFVLAAREQETPVVAGVVMFLVIVAILGSLVADILAAVLDPRLRRIA
jgi:oligopeptide transport system permease protein